MIEMWDSVFAEQNPDVHLRLDAQDGAGAFRAMHETLDPVWKECARVLRPGGFLCINIGDATRKIGNGFRLYTNHARVIHICEALGFQPLPAILWRKQTNAPNKFMGSGTLPSGAYVTLEHEHILLFRNGAKRTFAPTERDRRRSSAFFWEERNQWFSDVWDFKGARQSRGGRHPYHGDSSYDGGNGHPDDIHGTGERGNRAARAATDSDTIPGSAGEVESPRSRSAAFPVELAFRLINMYSLQGDTVLDPFVGTGTTTIAAMAAARNSQGFEIDRRFATTIDRSIATWLPDINQRQADRLADHNSFLSARAAAGGSAPGYMNHPHGVPVITRQETDLQLLVAAEVERYDSCDYRVCHRRLDGPSVPPRVSGFEVAAPE
jgi:DNA modification methylase